MEAAQILQEFKDDLKREGLLIVPKQEWEERAVANDLTKLQQRMLKKLALTYNEILKAQLLPVTSRQAIDYWVKNGKIKENEFLPKTPSHPKRVLTIAIQRLRNEY